METKSHRNDGDCWSHIFVLSPQTTKQRCALLFLAIVRTDFSFPCLYLRTIYNKNQYIISKYAKKLQKC